MKKIVLSSLSAVLMFSFASPVLANSTLHIWSCKLNDGKTTAEVMAVSSAWLKAAKSMEGGADLNLSLEFPLATDSGDSFNFVLEAADAKTWGLFMNGYENSPAAKADEAWGEVASCSRSSLWNSVDVE